MPPQNHTEPHHTMPLLRNTMPCRYETEPHRQQQCLARA
jgi:hypothetical protein